MRKNSNDPANRLDRARRAPVPKDIPRALAWLWSVYALIKSLFTRDLPELAPDLVPVEDESAPPYMVIAWRVRDVPILDERGTLLRIERRTEIVDSRRSYDPADVDMMIADLHTRHPDRDTIGLTLAGPGITIRLNRRARLAALSRVKRTFRREARAEARQVRENDRIERAERDRARRERMAA